MLLYLFGSVESLYRRLIFWKELIVLCWGENLGTVSLIVGAEMRVEEAEDEDVAAGEALLGMWQETCDTLGLSPLNSCL